MAPALVLVVDDDRDTRELYKLVYDIAGYRVTEAASVTEARRLADLHRPDVVLTDWRLGDGDGFALCGALRRHGRTRRIPIVAATGVSLSAEEIARARVLGCDPVMTKPLDLDTMVRVTGAALEFTRSRLLRAAAARVRRYAVQVRQDSVTGREDRRARASRLLSAARLRVRSQVGLIIADDEGHYVAANDQAAEFTGYDSQELVNLSLADLTPSPQVPALHELWSHFLADRTQEGVFMVRRRTGESVAMQYVAIADVAPGLHLSALSPAVPVRHTLFDHKLDPS
jgi:PAS domain S-box-containing protein